LLQQQQQQWANEMPAELKIKAGQAEKKRKMEVCLLEDLLD